MLTSADLLQFSGPPPPFSLSTAPFSRALLILLLRRHICEINLAPRTPWPFQLASVSLTFVFSPSLQLNFTFPYLLFVVYAPAFVCMPTKLSYSPPATSAILIFDCVRAGYFYVLTATCKV